MSKSATKNAPVGAWTFSGSTLAILKNFATIRNSILIEPGQTITTLSPSKHILGEAKVDEVFDKQFAIFDLNQFLAVVGLFENPTFLWEEKYVRICGKDGTEVKYIYADPDVIQIKNKKVTSALTPVVVFDWTEDQFDEVNNAARLLQLPHIGVRSAEEGGIEIIATDTENDSCNTFVSKIGSDSVDPNSTADSFSFVFDRDNLKILPGNYKVTIHSQNVAKFENNDKPLTYWITLQIPAN